MKNIRIFFAGVISIFVIYSAILIDTTFLQKHFAFSEPWVRDVYEVKDYINSLPTSKQRLLVFGGSSSLFGFNGEMVDNATKFHFINYGTHAGLPLNFHVDKIISVAKEGDIIFLPLEFPYYTNGAPTNDYWYIHNMLTWGNGYKKYITLKYEILAYFKNPPLYVFSTWFHSFKAKQHENIIENMKKIWQQNHNNFNYGYQSLSKHGDYCTQVGELTKIQTNYLYKNTKLSDFFLQEYNRLQIFAKSKHIKIFLTYPPTGENEFFSIHDKQTFEEVKSLETELLKHNIKIYGNFTDFHFDNKYFFNTDYHLNEKGVVLRTKAFIKLLQTMEKQNIL